MFSWRWRQPTAAVPPAREPGPPAPLTDGTPADERARLLLATWIPLGRELLKLLVIVIYLVLATALCVIDRNPVGFAPLLVWALGTWARRDRGGPGS